MDPGQILWEATYPPYLKVVLIQNATSPTVSVRFQPNVMINMGKYRLLLFWRSTKNENLENMGPYGAGNFKTLPL